MKAKNKKSTGKVNSKAEQKDSIFEKIFIDFKYSDFVLPGLYFLVMLFIAMTNRPIGGYGLETDFYWAYAPQAKEILKGILTMDEYRGPAYQIILAGAGLIFGKDFYTAGKFLNVLFSSISLFFIFKIITSIFNKRAAVFVVLFVLTNLYFLRYSIEPGTDMLFLVFYTSAIYFILKDNTFENKNFLIAGVLTGLAYLTRYTSIAIIFTVGLIFLVTLYKNSKSSSKLPFGKIVKPFVFYFIPILLTVSALGLYCYSKVGTFFYNKNFLNTAYTVYKPETMSNDEWTLNYQNSFTSLGDVVFKDIGQFFNKIFIQNFVSFFFKDLQILLPVYIGIFVAIGLVIFLIKFKTNNLQQRYLFLFSLIFYVQILFAFYSERFSLPILPFYCFLIVKMFDYDFLQKLNFRIGSIRFFSLILSLLIAINFYTSYKNMSEYINAVPTEIIKLRDLVKSNSKEDLIGKNIMARKPQIGYYMDMNFVVIPFVKNYDEFYDNVKKNDIDYVYTSEAEAGLIGQTVGRILIDYRHPPEGLELVANTVNPVSVLYKVKK